MLLWNGEEVKADITDIVMQDNAGGLADNMDIVFPDPEQAWMKWKPKKGDIVSATIDGWSSGDMFFDGHAIAQQAFHATAVATPPAGKSMGHRAWSDVEFFHIASDIARACGLALELYEVPNYRYDTVAQAGEANLGFLNRLCEREGLCLKVHNRKAVIFNEKTFENKPAALTIDRKDMGTAYNFGSGAALLKSRCTVMHYGIGGLITYTHDAPGIYGGSMQLEGYVGSIGEAQRFTKGALRMANKKEFTGGFILPLNKGIAAGNTVNLTGLGAYNGLWYLVQVKQYLLSNMTACRVRRPIEGDY